MIVIEPAAGPSCVGVKVTVIVQLVPALSIGPQSLLCAKSPLGVMPLILSVAVPILDKVTIIGPLVVPTA